VNIFSFVLPHYIREPRTLQEDMTSRVIIKNLPKYVNEKRLRDMFGAKGEITDVRLMKSQEGVFRRFAFLGYKLEEEAKAAVHYFNNAYMDTCKLSVELSKPYGDPNLPRPWSKYSNGSSAYKKKIKIDGTHFGDSGIISVENSSKEAADKSEITDPKLEEFLELTTSRTHSKLWANEGEKTAQQGINTAPEHIRFDDDDMVAIEKADTRRGESHAHENMCQDVSDIGGKEAGLKYQGFTNLDEPTISLDDFMNQKEQKQLQLPKEKNSSSTASIDMISNIGGMSPEETLLETGRLFVRNLSYLCTEDDLRNLFERFGPLTDVHLSISKETRKPKGFAYILYMIPEHAVKAYAELDGKIFQGRLLHLIAAMPKREIKPVQNAASATSTMTSSSTYKQKREQARKEMCHSEFNWNSLFMNSNTIAEAMAARMHLSKSELLDPGSENVAVRLALAEAQIVAETKRFLEEEGIFLDPLLATMKKERSRTCILVKNIPYSTEIEQLASLFQKYGDLNRILLPPTKAIALVDFADPIQAKVAFRNLAYTKFKDIPIYLEWAPLGIFTGKPKDRRQPIKDDNDMSNIVVQVNDNKKMETDVFSHDKTVDDHDIEPPERSTIFVKNINFITTDETFKKTFETIGELRHASIVKKNDMKHPGQTLSMGYGFVEYKKQEDGLKAIKMLQVSQVMI
jgi:multiple RNA-binding domain-containing protein 1